MSTNLTETAGRSDRAGVERFALTGAVTVMALYVLCWLAAQAGTIELPHNYLRLFTLAEVTSTYALLEGVVWSWIFGVLAGTIAGLTYNSLGAGSRSQAAERPSVARNR